MHSSIRHRLIAASVVILFVIAASGATAIVALQVTARGTEQTRIINHHLALLETVRRETRAIAQSARRYVLGGHAAEQQRVLAIIDEMRVTREALNARASLPDGAILEADLETFVAGVVNAMSADGDLRSRLSAYEDELEHVQNPLQVTFDQIAAHERSRRAALHSADTLARQARWAVLVATILGGVLVLGGVIALLRVLTPLEAVSGATVMQGAAMALRREPIDAAALLDRAIKDAREASLARAVRLRYEAQLALSVVADGERIRHVLDSLLQIAIATARSGNELVVHVAVAQGGVRFAIIEASPESNSVVGHDLALQQCSRIVEAHGGRLGIQTSAISRTYWFTLPSEPVALR